MNHPITRILTLLLGLALLTAVLAACGDSEAISVVKDYLKAGEQQDWEKANALLCDGGDANVANPFQALDDVELKDLKYAEKDSSGGKVTVSVQGILKVRMAQTSTRVEIGFQANFVVHKVDGSWCIAESDVMEGQAQ